MNAYRVLAQRTKDRAGLPFSGLLSKQSRGRAIMSRFFKPGFFCFLLLFGLILSGNVSAELVLKEALLSPDLYEGKEARLKLIFEWPAQEGAYEFRTPHDIKLQNLKLLDVSQTQETFLSSAGPVSRLILSYQMLPIERGQGTIHRFNILYRKPGAPKWETMPVPTTLVKINPPLSRAGIVILITLVTLVLLSFAILFFRASRIERKDEESAPRDPKQQIYSEAEEKLNGFITGHTASYIRTLLSDWSSELKKVVMTYFDIPVRSATKTEILKELSARNLPAGEIAEIDEFFKKLEHMMFSPGDMTSDELEQLRRSLLQYVKGKTILGKS